MEEEKSFIDMLIDHSYVLCSASQCRFKDNSGYYSKCRNPKVLARNLSFMEGRLYLSGCTCGECKDISCPLLQEYGVSDIKETNNEFTGEFIFNLPKERDGKGRSFSI